MKTTTLLYITLTARTSLAFKTPHHGYSRKFLQELYGTLDGKTIDGDFVPVNDMVLIKSDEKEMQTEGGLLLASKVKVKRNEGIVLSIGTGKIDQETGFKFDMPISKGEKIIYGRYVGTQIKYNGEPHVLIQDSDIILKYIGEKLMLDTAEMLRDNVLVKVEKKSQNESASGILIAKTKAKPKPTMGEVVKVGPGRYALNGQLMEMDVDVGDMIRFRDFAGNTVEIDDDEFSVVRMTDILAKF
mmetsp:Transcript_21075/g.24077  ORF Transcript_21075/g.24077 Transcript_21075/m.24077 type:complete len:243 (-) Transcript_21075:297-1025(-)|eukprot:CAMPEP_0194145260 /NCGR_PEP_ID=MMETSP0152-20130528/16007_1 /TAXON_ID=1049557 /ORGANISM="Thalassiothrix antarctica, Strain L6-D1" /LENGTH=242 /DNA_ID=CAMNT_0038845395 /DNA_START=40 /DNA_END=768 /DNA_ORIENTATION=+